MQKFGLVILIMFVNLGCSVFGIQNEEQPKYTIILEKDNMQIRKYSPYLVAQTTVQGNFDESQSKGFRILADYIFGENQSSEKIEMTAPVEQKKSEKIAMTSPVTMSPEEGEPSWTMRFSMPSKYTLETLPMPTDKRIQLVELPERFVAAIEFTGFWNESSNAKKANLLKQWVSAVEGYNMISEARFAGYNPPWTLPFLRRNEMLVDLESSDSK